MSEASFEFFHAFRGYLIGSLQRLDLLPNSLEGGRSLAGVGMRSGRGLKNIWLPSKAPTPEVEQAHYYDSPRGPTVSWGLFSMGEGTTSSTSGIGAVQCRNCTSIASHFP